jgi:hypothetical protein
MAQLTALFAHYEQPLTAEQCQQAIRLMRDIEAALQQQTPVTYVEWMSTFESAGEQTEELLLMAIAFESQGTSQQLACLHERRAMVAAFRRLAQTLEKIPALALIPQPQVHPGFLHVVAPPAEEQEGEEA